MAAAAAVPVLLPALGKAAKGAAGTISEALTADLAVIKWEGKRRKNRVPTQYEVHVNPAAIGVAAVGVGLALWLTQTRVGFAEVSVGRWRWPDGTWATEQRLTSEKGDTPQRLNPTPSERPTLQQYGGNAIAWAAAMAQWTLSNTQSATWIDQGMKTTPHLKERQGFLGDGTGTIISPAVLGLTLGPVGALLGSFGGLFK